MDGHYVATGMKLFNFNRSKDDKKIMLIDFYVVVFCRVQCHKAIRVLAARYNVQKLGSPQIQLVRIQEPHTGNRSRIPGTGLVGNTNTGDVSRIEIRFA